VSMLFTDVSLAGQDRRRGTRAFRQADLSEHPRGRDLGRPQAKRLPEGAKFLPKPWLPLDVLREGRAFAALTARSPARPQRF